MTAKEILHEILLDMNPYDSFGVPGRVRNLAERLCSEVYGNRGLNLFLLHVRQERQQISATSTIYTYVVQKWEDKGNTEVLSEGLIERLEAL